MGIEQVLREKRQEILRIASSYGARSVRVFGSTAKQKASEISDLDILVELEPGRTLLDIIAMKQDLEDLLQCRVDVLTESSLSPYVGEEVLREAVSL